VVFKGFMMHVPIMKYQFGRDQRRESFCRVSSATKSWA